MTTVTGKLENVILCSPTSTTDQVINKQQMFMDDGWRPLKMQNIFYVKPQEKQSGKIS